VRQPGLAPVQRQMACDVTRFCIAVKDQASLALLSSAIELFSDTDDTFFEPIQFSAS